MTLYESFFILFINGSSKFFLNGIVAVGFASIVVIEYGSLVQ